MASALDCVRAASERSRRLETELDVARSDLYVRAYDAQLTRTRPDSSLRDQPRRLNLGPLKHHRDDCLDAAHAVCNLWVLRGRIDPSGRGLAITTRDMMRAPHTDFHGRGLTARSCSHSARSIEYSTSPSSSPGILTGQWASNVRT